MFIILYYSFFNHSLDSAEIYDDGPDALTHDRLRRLKEIRLVNENIKYAPPIAVLGKVESNVTRRKKPPHGRWV